MNVKGLKSLDESLDDYLSVEELRDENQYFCELCKIRVDAIRSIKLQTLPDVLNFQLKRYVFLPKVFYDVFLREKFHFLDIIVKILQQIRMYVPPNFLNFNCFNILTFSGTMTG